MERIVRQTQADASLKTRLGDAACWAGMKPAGVKVMSCQVVYEGLPSDPEPPEICEKARLRDWEYAGWYVEMLGFAERGEMPVALADWGECEPDPRFIETLGSPKGLRLPAPPPGRLTFGSGAAQGVDIRVDI